MKKYTTIRNYAKLHHKQAGMTLIELTVVLLILVGLAGLLIPYVSGFMEKTHDSTSVATIAELNNTIQRHQVSKMTLPSQLESLYDGTAVYGYMQQGAYLTTLAAPAAGGDAGALANASLAKAGIKNVFNMDPTTTDATFQSTTGTAITLDTNPFDATHGGTDLVILQGNANGGDQSFFGQLSAGLQAATAARANGLTNADPELKNQLIYAFGGNEEQWDTNCTNYVVMGIGSANTLIPSSMQSAPVMFGSNGDEAPKLKYARYVGVFAVPKTAAACTSDAANVTAPTADAAARFVGAAADMAFPALVGLSGAQQWTNNNLAKN